VATIPAMAAAITLNSPARAWETPDAVAAAVHAAAG